jgi:ribonuclease P protein component
MALPKNNRMTKRDFTKRFKTGRRVRGRYCSLQYGPIETAEPKIAVVVQSKIAPLASTRNRIRRILNEYLGSVVRSFSRPVFVVVIVHVKLEGDDKERCRMELESMLKKSGIIDL